MEKVLVAYISVVGIRSEDFESYMSEVAKRITPEDFKGTIIFIPTNEQNSRIECIDPKYITEQSLILQNEELMKRLNSNLENQIKEYEKD